MKIVGTMPVRNEAWILGYTARVALRWLDHLVILLHACEDGSERIATDLAKEFWPRVTILHHEAPKWDEMAHRQYMLEEARRQEATHIAIVDADEALTGNLFERIREACRLNLQPGSIMQLPGYNLRGGIERYHNNGIWGNRWFSCVFPEHPRYCWRSDRFHHREPFIFGSAQLLTPAVPFAQGEGGVLHFWGASERRLRAKHAMYKVTERLRWPHKDIGEIERMYSWAIRGTGSGPDTPEGWKYATVPAGWLCADLLHHIDLDGVPWQEAAVREAVAAARPGTFDGLDLFGIA